MYCSHCNVWMEMTKQVLDRAGQVIEESFVCEICGRVRKFRVPLKDVDYENEDN